MEEMKEDKNNYFLEVVYENERRIIFSGYKSSHLISFPIAEQYPFCDQNLQKANMEDISKNLPKGWYWGI